MVDHLEVQVQVGDVRYGIDRRVYDCSRIEPRGRDGLGPVVRGDAEYLLAFWGWTAVACVSHRAFLSKRMPSMVQTASGRSIMRAVSAGADKSSLRAS